MKLSRTVTYALKATLQLASQEAGSPIPCSRLAAQGAMPERFLLQILRSLVTHGILKSTRGVDGGYLLLRSAADVSVLDVIEAIDGPLTHELVLGEGLAESSCQMLDQVLSDVNEGVRETLGGVKLADLLQGADVVQVTPRAEALPSPCETQGLDAKLPTRVEQLNPSAFVVPSPILPTRSNEIGPGPTIQPLHPHSGAGFEAHS